MIRFFCLPAVAVFLLAGAVSAEPAAKLRPLVLHLPVAHPAAAEPATAYKKYCTVYKNHPHYRTCRLSCTTQQVMMEVKDPCGCPVLVSICLPSCCEDAPVVCTGRDILHRFSYTYEWRSGYKVDIVFRRRGDIVVHSWGS